MDDYSRYINGLGFYRSQMAEHVIETYRCAVGEYEVPKEMLTDNGRQYTNWRGTTRFEKELAKDRVKHIKSRRCLYGKNACRSFFAPSRLRYNKRKMKQAYDWITDLAVDISAACGKSKISPAALRIASRKWMEEHRLIVTTKPVKMLPHFF